MIGLLSSFIYPLIYSHKKEIRACYVPDTVIDTDDIAVNKTDVYLQTPYILLEKQALNRCIMQFQTVTRAIKINQAERRDRD